MMRDSAKISARPSCSGRQLSFSRPVGEAGEEGVEPASEIGEKGGALERRSGRWGAQQSSGAQHQKKGTSCGRR